MWGMHFTDKYMKTDFNTLQALSTEYKSVPVLDCVEAGSVLETFKIFKNISKHCFILESLEDKTAWGRWTVLGFSPKLEVSCVNSKLTIKNGPEITIYSDDPKSVLQKILDDNKSPSPNQLKIDDFPPFSGGLVGYFSFEYIKYSEKSLYSLFEASEKAADGDTDCWKDFDLMVFDKVLCWDHLKNQLIIVVNIKTDALNENYKAALIEIEKIKRVILNGEKAVIEPCEIKTEYKALFSKEQYCKMVEKAKHYINEGDIFQVVLANQMTAGVKGSIFDTYRNLRKINPSPYMFYFSSDDIEIAGSSPETLVKLQDGKLWTFPLAGTRRRGKDDAEDAALEKELLSDPKETAEHNMLVDLGRNDLGRLCEFGSVKVEKYMSIEKFSHVMHIGSTVCGKIKKEFSALDAIAAVLPAGTLSGAPKIRACEIIAELEKNRRGIYGGAIGYIDFNGNMDTCISIRIAYKKNDKIFVRSGAGIVADSVSENEYEECLNKMKAVMSALDSSAPKSEGI
ncbi:MAG: anthranilate synthase component I [Termitinemataceae bacterium]|nr:MAG: anthranilate synthase component I [Termitinemataceae bacterium]